MKVNYPVCFFLGAALLLGHTASAQAQRAWHKVCDKNGNNCHVDNEIMVQFNASSLDMANVSNQGLTSAPLAFFLTPQALDSLSNAVGFDMASVTAYKVAPDFNPYEPTMEDRTGETIEVGNVWAMFLLALPKGSDEEDLSYRLRDLFPLIRFAHLNWTVDPLATANDTYYSSSQASLHPTASFANAGINIEGAWNYGAGKSTIKVGVADTGIKANHPDLQFGTTPIVAGGYDGILQTSPGNSLIDPVVLVNNGDGTYSNVGDHGTPVAGIIGAARFNATGIAGIAGGNSTTQGVSLYSLKCLGDGGDIYAVTEAILKGIAPVANGGFGLNIINNSYVVKLDRSTRLLAWPNFAGAAIALRLAHRAKVTMVAGAGNDVSSGNFAYFPAQARDTWTLTVGGSDEVGKYWRQVAGVGNNNASTPHPFVDVAAPAASSTSVAPADQPVFSLSSTAPAGYGAFSGTSAAAPHATGVAALMMSYYNKPAEILQPEDVENLLKIHAKDITVSPAQTGKDDFTGAGLIDATSVMDGLRNNIVYHSPAASVANPAAAGVDIAMMPGATQEYYMEGGERVSPGVYTAEVWRVQVNADGYYKPDYVVTSRWGLNNSSSFYGPPVPFNGASFNGPIPSQMVVLENEARVVGPVGKTIVVLEGYAYKLTSRRRLIQSAGQPPQIDLNTDPSFNTTWVPFDPTVNPYQQARSMRYAGYAVNTKPIVNFRATGADSSPAGTKQSVAYPNPTIDRATLTFAATEEETTNPVEVQITTLAGQVMKTAVMKVERWDEATGAVQVSLGGLPTGSYLYRIKTAAQVRQGRINKTE